MSERKYTWRVVTWGREALVDANGKIVGEVSSGFGTKTATAGGAMLGEYVDLADARRAVERKVSMDPSIEWAPR